jgi:speckle-type POZ protein
MWRIVCYPRGDDESDNGEYLSLFLELLSTSTSGKAICDIFLLNKNGQSCSRSALRTRVLLPRSRDAAEWGFISSMSISWHDLKKDFLTEGHITWVCSVMVSRDVSIPMAASDIGKHFGMLLDSMDGTDVSFTIDNETFHAHRAVLAARSPVFKAELLGSKAESTMSNITLYDIAPATFRVMLRFIYTDALPRDDELGDSPLEMMRHLLAAADRYALDRLKLICAQRLLDGLSVDTVSTTLVCAEMYSCLELKSKCIDFFTAGENFKKVFLTEGFIQLVQHFPSIIDELRERMEL